MKWIVCQGYETMCQKAGEQFKAFLSQKPDGVLGLATGSSPLGLYDYFARQTAAGAMDFSRVTTFNLDEYVPMAEDHPQSYRYFMDHNLFSRINIDPGNTFVPKGEETLSCSEYDQMIRKRGGIDLQLLGVGHNGHIGFNEPGERLIAGTHITKLAPSTLSANARFFGEGERVPDKAVTMGMATIMSAKEILVLIGGRDKHPVVNALLDDGVTTHCPATFLKLHPRVTIYCDKEAYEG